MSKKPAKTIESKLLADALSVGLEISVGYLYFVTLRKVSPLVKIPALMAANRLLVTGLNAGINKFESMR